MNRHAANPDPATHHKVQQLLPWLLAGTLDSAERALAESHVQACEHCRADLDWQRKLRSAAHPPDGGFDADRAFAKLLPRLGPQAPRLGVLERWRTAAAANSPWLRWTALAQLAAIGVLSILLARSGDDSGDYRAMGAAPQAQGGVVVVFKPDTTEREVRRILQASGARVADGPTVTGAYVLALPVSQARPALARLRAEPAVTLAQPLTAESPP